MESDGKDRAKIGKQASIEGFANEHIAAGILMKKYHNVSLVDLPLSPYDLIIVIKEKDEENIIRAQVKTSPKSVSFTGGGRGGVDRQYISDIKVYKHSIKTADVIIGVCPEEKDNNLVFHLYFVPTILIEKLKQKSISLNKINALKNNYEVLERCKDYEFILKKFKKYKIL